MPLYTRRIEHAAIANGATKKLRLLRGDCLCSNKGRKASHTVKVTYYCKQQKDKPKTIRVSGKKGSADKVQFSFTAKECG